MKVLKNDAGDKIAWQGVLLSIQPRIRLTRSFDQRSHIYLGYALKVHGRVGTEAREFLVGVGQGDFTGRAGIYNSKAAPQLLNRELNEKLDSLNRDD